MSPYGDAGWKQVTNYGIGRIPSYQANLASQGTVDPAALRAMAQGLPYDIDARRDAIAAQLSANQQAQAAYQAPPPVIQNPFLGFSGGGVGA
jgi:hypothetical protein